MGMSFSESLPPPSSSSPLLLFSDPVYGCIQLPKLVQDVLKHPLFLRLSEVHQLALAQFVFTRAQHTRAEHSKGVAYLGFLAVDSIRKAQPTLGLSDRQVLWVTVAGLCHDIGHGPFSHAWEKVFEMILPDQTFRRHESRSLALCRRLLSSLPTLFDVNDIAWICWIIEPALAPQPPPSTYRPEWHFLSEIVCNILHGIDVDKLDYLARDTHYLCATTPCDVAWDGFIAREIVARSRALPTTAVAQQHDEYSGGAASSSAQQQQHPSETHWVFNAHDAAVLVGLPALRQHMHFVYYQSPQVVLLDATMQEYIQLAVNEGVITSDDLLSLDFLVTLTDASVPTVITDRAISKQADEHVLERLHVAWERVCNNAPTFAYAGSYMKQDASGTFTNLVFFLFVGL